MGIELVSVHFPKAGGTSLRHTYLRAYGAGSVYPVYDDDPIDPCSLFSLDPDGSTEATGRASFPPTVRVVHGHFHPAKFDHFPDAKRVVFLRHPVDNMISIYFYWLTVPDGHALFRSARDRKLSLLQVARMPKLRYLLSRSYFGGFDVGRMDFVGSMEHYASDVQAFGGWLGLPLDESNENRNASATYTDDVRAVREDVRLMAQLHDLLGEDVATYSQAMKRRAEILASLRPAAPAAA